MDLNENVPYIDIHIHYDTGLHMDDTIRLLIPLLISLPSSISYPNPSQGGGGGRLQELPLQK